MTWATNHPSNLSGGACPGHPSLASRGPLRQEGVAVLSLCPSPLLMASPSASRARLCGRVRLLAAVLGTAILLTSLEN